jgi:hypothetical protein
MTRVQCVCWLLFVIGFVIGWHQMPHDFFAAVCAGGVPVVALLLVRSTLREHGHVI